MICAIDGLFLGSKYTVMEIVSMKWVTKVREGIGKGLGAGQGLIRWVFSRRQANHTPAYHTDRRSDVDQRCR